MEDIKNQINEKKIRISQLKQEAREKIESKPTTPRELAPVKNAPKKAPPPTKKPSEPWQRHPMTTTL